MKVLFAIGDAVTSENIAKQYYALYGEKIEYKDVYFFKALLDEVKKDKTYDRIVIAEQLEPPQRNVVDAIDQMIFNNIDSITDELEDSTIIFICSDGRTKNDSLIGRLFNIGIYNLLMGDERDIVPLCQLIKNPRNKKEAKEYLKSNPAVGGSVGVTSSEDEVDEVELVNISKYFNNLKGPAEYLEKFSVVEEQYNQKQLQTIVIALYQNLKKGREIYETLSMDPRYSKYCVLPISSSKQPNKKGKNARENSETGPNNSSEKQPSSFGGILGFLAGKKANEKNSEVIKGAVNRGRIESNNASYSNQMMDNSEIYKNADKAAEKARLEADEMMKKAEQESRAQADRLRKESEERRRLEKEKREEELKQQQENMKRVQEAQLKAQQEAMIKAQQEAQLRAQEEQLKKEQEELKKQQEELLKRQQEELLKRQQEELKRQQEEFLKKQQEELLKQQEEVSSKQQEELRKQQEELLRKQQEELKKQQEEMLKKQQEEVLKKQQEEQLKRQQEEIKRQQEEQLRKQQEEIKRQQEEQLRARQQAELKAKQEQLMAEKEKLREKQAELNSEINNANEEEESSSSYSTPSTSQVFVPIDYKKMIVFVGTNKVGTTFIANTLANLMAMKGVKTSLLDMTGNRGLYWYYNERLYKKESVVANCMSNLSSGVATPVQVGKYKNLNLYTTIPGGKDDNRRSYKHRNIIETARRNCNLLIVDCDFTTSYEYLDQASEVYIVQDLDLIKVKETKEFFRELKMKGMDWNKLRIVMNNCVKCKVTTKKILKNALTYYNDPSMTFTEEFDEIKKYVEIGLEPLNYVNYIESMEDGKLDYEKFTPALKASMEQLALMAYGATNSSNKKKGLFN